MSGFGFADGGFRYEHCPDDELVRTCPLLRDVALVRGSRLTLGVRLRLALRAMRECPRCCALGFPVGDAS